MNKISDQKYALQIPIFEKGYEKDPAIVAKEAIQEASRNNSDVVLVDTAGRMQVKSLLRCLVKLCISTGVIEGWPIWQLRICLCNVYFLITFQDNEPLMRALSKLININNPDLVLFVGEALVGNDAVDQLSKFNQVQKNKPL